MLVDLVPLPASLLLSPFPLPSTPTVRKVGRPTLANKFKVGRPAHANQFTARKKLPPTQIGEATLAGSSSRQPHIDPHATPPPVIPVDYEIIVDRSRVQAYIDKWEAKEYLQLRPDHLQWSPFLVTRGYGVDVPVGSIAKAPGGDVGEPNDGVGDGEAAYASAAASLAARAGNGLGTNHLVEQEINALAVDTIGSPKRQETTRTTSPIISPPSALSPMSQLLAASEAESPSFSNSVAAEPVTSTSALANGHAHSSMDFQTQFNAIQSSIAPSPLSSTAATSLFTSAVNSIARWSNGAPRGNQSAR